MDTVNIPRTFKVIATKCYNTGGAYGVLASLENTKGEVILTTDTQWKCSSTMTDGWEMMAFDGHSSWPSASVQNRTKQVNKIRREAKWIWTGHGYNNLTYCRYQGKKINLGKFIPSI